MSSVPASLGEWIHSPWFDLGLVVWKGYRPRVRLVLVGGHVSAWISPFWRGPAPGAQRYQAETASVCRPKGVILVSEAFTEINAGLVIVLASGHESPVPVTALEDSDTDPDEIAHVITRAYHRHVEVYWGGPFLRARFFVRFEDQNRDLLCHIVFSNFHSLEALEACLRPASKLAPKCFVLIPMVSRRWSSRLALRPASNYTFIF